MLSTSILFCFSQLLFLTACPISNQFHLASAAQSGRSRSAMGGQYEILDKIGEGTSAPPRVAFSWPGPRAGCASGSAARSGLRCAPGRCSVSEGESILLFHCALLSNVLFGTSFFRTHLERGSLSELSTAEDRAASRLGRRGMESCTRPSPWYRRAGAPCRGR